MPNPCLLAFVFWRLCWDELRKKISATTLTMFLGISETVQTLQETVALLLKALQELQQGMASLVAIQQEQIRTMAELSEQLKGL